MKDWEEIITTSEMLAVQEIKQSFEDGNYVDVEYGLNELLESMARSEKRALESQLIRLMLHIIKWQIQTKKRSRSWLGTIRNARFEIRKIQKYAPSLNNKFVENIWEEAFTESKEEAELETGISTNNIEILTWQEVFEKEYILESEDQ